jgi:hypothetical protein
MPKPYEHIEHALFEPATPTSSMTIFNNCASTAPPRKFAMAIVIVGRVWSCAATMHRWRAPAHSSRDGWALRGSDIPRQLQRGRFGSNALPAA